MVSKASLLRALAALALLTMVAGCADDSPSALVASAKTYLAKHDPNAAAIQLKNALSKDPEHAEARFLLGQTLAEQGDYGAAEKELRRALSLKYPPERVVPVLSGVLLRSGKGQALIDEFGKTQLPAGPERAEFEVNLGQAYRMRGDTKAADAAFAAALADQPDNIRARMGQAELKAAAGDLAGAIAITDEVLAKAPTTKEALQLKGDVLRTQGKRDEALALYRKAIEGHPDYLLAHAAIVSTLVREGRPDEAKPSMDTLLKLAPNHLETLYLDALYSYAKKDLPRARQSIERYLTSVPDNVAALLLAASIQFEAADYQQAEKNLRNVLQRAPDQAYARQLLGATLARSGQPQKALDALKPVLSKSESNADLLSLAGGLYMQAGDSTRALQYFEKAAALDPKNPSKRTAVAVTRYAMGDTEAAVQELEATAATDPGNSADVALITAMMRRGDAQKAMQAIDALQKKQPKSPLAPYLRGVVQMAAGEVAGARRSFEQSLANDAGFFPAAGNLARLDMRDKAPEKAKKRLEDVLAKNPRNIQAMLALADLRAATGGNAQEVAADIQKAVAANPTDSAPRLALILYYLRTKDAKSAVQAAQDAMAALPDRPEILDAAGQAQRAAGDVNQALLTYKRLVEIRPDTPIAYMRLAEAQFASKDNEAAADALRRALAIKPDLLEAQRGLMLLELKAGRTQRAVDIARQVQKQRPKDSIGYRLEGDTYASLKDWPKAEAAYKTGLDHVSSPDLAVKLHAAYVADGKTADAERVGASWQKAHPNDTTFLLYLAELARTNRDYPRATQIYQHLTELQPKNAGYWNNLAWVAMQNNDPKALEYGEKALALAPAQPEIMDTVGTVLVQRGDANRGVELLRKATAQAPQAASIRLNLARALIKTGDKQNAKKELQELAKLGDKFSGQPEVTSLLNSL